MSDIQPTMKEADRAIDEAVEAANQAHAAEAGLEPGIVVDYLVLYTTRRYDEDGDPLTGYGIQWPSDSRTTHYAALGMLMYAQTKITRQLFDDGNDDG
jgi:hypothetical protein